MYTLFVVIPSKYAITTVGFQRDIAHVTASLLLDIRGFIDALLNDLSKAPKCILLNLLNVKLLVRGLASHIQRVGNSYL